jgi:hypothetical protein
MSVSPRPSRLEDEPRPESEAGRASLETRSTTLTYINIHWHHLLQSETTEALNVM